ncbi:hypothetical protein WJX74_008895 [Apatococcus lobatus]|uniref:Dolichol-phosphate mannosyltransferase subunit 3 n=2 Tax=Apatococcus TaxID=904362 RepID=A0AAW1SV99_9CHLO
MLRIVRFGAFGALCLAVWFAVLSQDLGQYRRSALLAPLLPPVLLGLYMLALLVYGVLTFRTVPEAAAALQEDITAAKSDLASRGVI